MLFLGNSISLHPICSYWWGEWGMSATKYNNDYVHKTVNQLLEEGNGINYNVVNFGIWEMTGHDRAECLPLINPFLYKTLDIIVVQLGENVVDMTTFESDCKELINYIHAAAEEAHILMVSNWGSKQIINTYKRKICDELHIDYVDISSIQGETYKANIGMKVLGNDGNSHTIEHDGVARHPGDAGHKAIAEMLVKEINQRISN